MALHHSSLSYNLQLQDNLNSYQNDSKKFWKNIKDVLPGNSNQMNKISLKDQNQNFA